MGYTDWFRPIKIIPSTGNEFSFPTTDCLDGGDVITAHEYGQKDLKKSVFTTTFLEITSLFLCSMLTQIFLHFLYSELPILFPLLVTSATLNSTIKLGF